MANAAWLGDAPLHLSIRPLRHEVLGELLLGQGGWRHASCTVQPDLLHVRIPLQLHGMLTSLDGLVRSAVFLGVLNFDSCFIGF